MRHEKPSADRPAPQRRLRAALLATVLGAPFVAGMLAADGAAQAETGQKPAQPNQDETRPLLPSLHPMIEKVMPAVVNVSVMTNQHAKGTKATRSPVWVALGSGFVIDPRGYLVTNSHVVADAATITVAFPDGSKHTAKIVGLDPPTDIALLKIDASEPLAYVAWGDSDAAKVGDWVIAVGNPFGLGGTVTTGIISALGRDIQSGPFDDFIQLDAPINRGNSGGPTFNMEDEVIGINTAIYSPSGGSVGIGFAIPSNVAKAIVSQLEEHGKVTRGWLGVQIQQLTPEIARSLRLANDHGALIADVAADSPAAKAGLKQGDVILKYNGKEVQKTHDLPLLVAETPPGQAADMTIWRDDTTRDVTVKVGELSSRQVASVAAGEGQNAPQSALGMQFGPLTAQMHRRLNVPASVQGVVVTHVNRGSPAADLGIEVGDVLVAINQEPVDSPEAAAQKLKQVQQSGVKDLLLLLNRHGVNQYLGLSVG